MRPDRVEGHTSGKRRKACLDTQFTSASLIAAVKSGDCMRVSELLANGAPVDGAPNSKDGSTALVPLVAAIKDGNLEIVRQLLLHGARVDAPDEQESTALILACMYGHDKVVRLLLEHGADLEACDANGWTPLRLGCYFGHVAVTRVLLDARALLDSECSKDGMTALSSACDGWHLSEHLSHQRKRSSVFHWEVARLLVSHGATPPLLQGDQLASHLNQLHMQSSVLLVLANRKNAPHESLIALLPLELLLRVLHPLTRSFTMCDVKRDDSTCRISPTYMQARHRALSCDGPLGEG